jgi:major intracellular serine protease
MNKKIGLLPYTEEPLYGMSPNNPTIKGWEITKFNIPSYWKQSRGENVVVGVIDTGVDFNHEDLKNNIITGKNFIENNQEPMDVCGHGTHVSSTIAAEDNGCGIVGVANKTKIMPIKGLDNNGNGNTQSIVSAIKFAADAGVDFITMSLGSPNPSRYIEDAIKYAAKKGCIIFCAAGNSGPAVDIMYPAKYDHTISIGAIDKNLNRTNFTCSGDSLDFLAPGHEIIGCIPNNKYSIMSGTSMSNPFAVGLACLLLSYNKSEKRHSLKTCEDYIEIFKKTSTDLSDPRYKGIKKYQGYGIIHPTL